MAIILYPEENYNGFLDVATCDALILENIPSTQTVAYDAITEDSDKEIYIKQATTIIRNSVKALPYTLESDLQLATAYLVNYSVGVDVLNDDGNGNVKRINIADSTVEKEYFAPNKANNDLPDIVSKLLAQYGVQTSGTFSFSRS